MKKKILMSVVCMILLVSVIGCSTKESTGSEKNGEKVEFKFAYEMPIDHPGHKSAEKFAEILKEKSNGQIKVTLFPAAQLGGSREVMTSLMNGGVEMGTSSTFGTVEKKMLVMDLPYLFKDFDHISKFIGSDVSTDLLSSLNAHEVHGLGYWTVGFRNIGNNVKPVKTPEDLDGLLIRGFENEMLKDTLSALGANVTVLPYPEVYMALSTGTIEGEENPYVNTHAMKFYEVEKYKTETRHINNFNVVGANLEWWNSLSEENQKIITESFNEATTYYMDLMKEADEEYKKSLIDEGMEVIEIADYQPWVDAVQPVYEKWEKEIGADLIESIRGLE